MNPKSEKKLFIFLFSSAVVIFCIVVIFLILLLIKASFMFFPAGFDIIGINFSPTQTIY